MKKLILIPLLLFSVFSYSQTNTNEKHITTYKVSNAINTITREKAKKLKIIKIYSDSLNISKIGNYKIISIKTDENHTYFNAENNHNKIKLCIGSNNNGKLDLLNTNKSIEFDY